MRRARDDLGRYLSWEAACRRRYDPIVTRDVCAIVTCVVALAISVSIAVGFGAC